MLKMLKSSVVVQRAVSQKVPSPLICGENHTGISHCYKKKEKKKRAGFKTRSGLVDNGVIIPQGHAEIESQTYIKVTYCIYYRNSPSANQMLYDRICIVLPSYRELCCD